MTKPVIAIDGPAASGKGTLARRIAAELGVAYLDTGLLYRAVSRRLLDSHADTEQAAEAIAATLTPTDLDRPDLRTPDIDRIVSRVAAWPAVRAALLERQRLIARSGAVLDGRDIGTVVCPDAHAKLFVTASSQERARRRLLQRGETPTEQTLATERAALEARDAADAARSAAPFVRAPDAELLDTTTLDPEQSFEAALALIRVRLGRPGALPLDPAKGSRP